MRLDDSVIIETPEGVQIELTLAGAGSRFVSALVDLALQSALLVAALFATGATGATDDVAASTALYSVLAFVIVFGYDVFFEVLVSGRTPGKRLNRLRVVRMEGQPVGFVTSSIRNALRLVDFLPFAYVVGAAAILATRRNQRLGDLAAGTLVIRELQQATADERAATVPAAVQAWDTTAITAQELAAVRQFLARRGSIDPAARAELARALAERLRPKVGGVGDVAGDEAFLALLAAVRAARAPAGR